MSTMSKFKKKINIAIYENLRSGGARKLMLSNLAYLKNQNQFRITVLKPEPSDFSSFTNYLGYIYNPAVIFKKPNQLANYINNNYDLLISYHSWITKSPYILRYIKIPQIYICHEGFREFYEKDIRKYWGLKEYIVNILRFPLFLIDIYNVKNSGKLCLVSNSKFSKNKIDKLYNVDSKVVYPGINSNLTNLKVNKQNAIISVGSIISAKGFDFLIKIVGKVPEKIRPELIIVGNDENKKYVNHLKKIARKEAVLLKIYNNVSEKDLLLLYSKSKIFLYSPFNEPFGLVVLEAMAMGLPILASSNGGGYTEILNNGKTGFVLPTSKTKNWVSKIIDLLTNEKLNNKIGQYNKKVVKRYSNTEMNKKLHNIIIRQIGLGQL